MSNLDKYLQQADSDDLNKIIQKFINLGFTTNKNAKYEKKISIIRYVGRYFIELPNGIKLSTLARITDEFSNNMRIVHHQNLGQTILLDTGISIANGTKQ